MLWWLSGWIERWIDGLLDGQTEFPTLLGSHVDTVVVVSVNRKLQIRH